MGKYTDEANAFKSGIGRVKDQLGGIDKGANNVLSGLSGNNDDIISSKVSSSIEGITKLKDGIIQKLAAISESVMNKAIELDLKLEEEERIRQEAEKERSGRLEGDKKRARER